MFESARGHGIRSAVLLCAFASAASAQSDGAALCDGSGTVVSKAVGTERWSIQYDVLTNTANGIVFDPDTGSASFVSCFRTGASVGQYSFACAAPDGVDPSTWVTFAENVSLGTDFFRLDGFVGADLRRLTNASLGAVFDLDGTYGGLQWDLEGEVGEDGVLRGRNPANENPVAIQATFTLDRPGVGPADFYGIEYADGECLHTLFNVREEPVPAGDPPPTVAGFVLGRGFRTPRAADGSCEPPGDDLSEFGVAGRIRLSFHF